MRTQPTLRIFFPAAALALSVAISPYAGAQVAGDVAAQAQALFDQALDEMDAGKYQAACPKLEESNRIDPRTGTKFHLARCYESTRKIASAWSLYIEVEAASRQAGKIERAQQAKERAAALKPRLPQIQVVVAPAVAGLPGLDVQRNGVPMGAPTWGTKIPVDPGAQRIVATAAGKKPLEQTVEMVEGKVTEVHIDALQDAPPAPTPSSTGSATTAGSASPAPSSAPAEGTSGMRVAGIAVGGIGLAGLAAGAGLGAAALSGWSSAIEGCQKDSTGTPIESTCPNTDSLRAAGSSAETLAHASTAAFAVGGAALGAGVLLLLLAPARTPAANRTGFLALPMISAERAGLMLTGSF